ncbi:MAG TPA: T9SS type A sorting domain-containing protein [Saprospiraceae bacterium]|nr:T9SS type A sorting domain-containing protein [Saprospiraceae bacterium]HQW27511.1 T9SS type A sorting domain-containing protein [Saprospiraceae bacterium]
MKALVLLSFLLSFPNAGSACSFLTDPFCTTLALLTENLVLTGVIVGVDDTGIDIEVLEILRGEESRDTIRIWDGTDFDCNGPWSMAAADIGAVNDTIIIILPKITSIENVWDVPGDYRRPDPYLQTSHLTIRQGNAKGFIAGDTSAPPEYNLWSIDYNHLTSTIIAEGECPFIILAAEEAKAASSITVYNPVDDVIRVQVDYPVHNGYVTLYSMNGYPIIKKEISGERDLKLECEDLPAGMYLLEVYTRERRDIKKIIKLNSM